MKSVHNLLVWLQAAKYNVLEILPAMFPQTLVSVTYVFLLGSILSTVTGQPLRIPHQNYTGVQGVTYCHGNDPQFGEVTAVFQTECERVPCHVRTDRKYTLLIEIIPYEDHLGLDMTGTVLALGREIKLGPYNACDFLALDGKCPIQKGRRHLFAVSPDVPKLLPEFVANYLRGQTIRANILVSLEDRNTGSKICVVLPEQATFV